MVDVRATLTDGKYHDTDSSEIAFKIAGSLALKEAAQRAKPVLLEPVMAVEVVTPQEFLGDVIGDLSTPARPRRGPGAAGNALAVKGQRAAVGDVRLRDRPALHHPGPRATTRCSSTATRKSRTTSPRRSSSTAPASRSERALRDEYVSRVRLLGGP